MTNYLQPDLETWKPFKPPQRYTPKDNTEELNNLGHEEVTEDFEDSPFADRK